MSTTLAEATNKNQKEDDAPFLPRRIDEIMAATPPNARDAIERLLTTETSPGKYCAGCEISRPIPIPTVAVILRDEDGEPKGLTELSFPLDEKDVRSIKDNAERAGVGVLDKTIVNLDVRKT